MMKFSAIIAILALGLAVVTAQGAVLFQEDFNGANPAADFDDFYTGTGMSVDFSNGQMIWTQTGAATGGDANAGFYLEDIIPAAGAYSTLLTLDYNYYVNANHTVHWGWPWQGMTTFGEYNDSQGIGNPDLGGYVPGVFGYTWAFYNHYTRFTGFSADPASVQYNSWDMGNGTNPLYIACGWYDIKSVLNPTPNDTTYVGPDGTTSTLEFEAYDIWWRGEGTGGEWVKAWASYAFDGTNPGVTDMMFQYMGQDDTVGGQVGFDDFIITDTLPSSQADWDLAVVNPLPWDLSGNGVVDFADFLAFQTVFGTNDAAADWSGNGVVDFADFLIFQTHFGETLAPAVPEPATMSLLALGGLALIRRRR